MMNIINKAKRARFRVPSKHDMLHHSYKGMHTSYFGLVFLEGHGLYAATGGVLAIFSIADFFLHFEE